MDIGGPIFGVAYPEEVGSWVPSDSRQDSGQRIGK